MTSRNRIVNIEEKQTGDGLDPSLTEGDCGLKSVQHCVFPRDAAFAFSCGLVERVESECLLEVDVTVELPVLIIRALLQSALASSTSLTRIHDFNASFTREREKNG